MSFGIKLHEYLYGDWDQVRDALVQELDYLHNTLRLNWDSVFDENNSLKLDAALAPDSTPTRYIANTGVDGAPMWDQVNLSNGVKGTLSYTHLPTVSASHLLGRGSASSGDMQTISLGTGLQMTGTVLSADASTIGGGTPYFIPDGETHTVPTNMQELFAMTIDVEGILDVEGFLIHIDDTGSGKSLIPLVDGNEPPNFITDGNGNLILVEA